MLFITFDILIPWTCIMKTYKVTHILIILLFHGNCASQKSTKGHTPSVFGVLHTLTDFIKWHVFEEQLLFPLLKKRLELLRSEMIVIKNSLDISRNIRHQGFRTHFPLILKLKKIQTISSFIKTSADGFKVLNSSEANVWPGPPDMFFSFMAFLHLQENYLLTPEQLFQGLTFQAKSGGKLRPAHCSEIGVFAIYQRRYNLAVEWLELVKRRSSENRISKNLDELFLWIAVQEHNLAGYRTLSTYESLINLYISPIQSYGEVRLSTREQDFQDYRGWNKTDRLDIPFWDLCMGNVYQPLEFKTPLKCYYDHRNDPYLYISPLKTEHLSESPPIYQFYQILGNSLIERIKLMSRPKVKSEVVDYCKMESIGCGPHAKFGMDYRENTTKQLRLWSERVSSLKIMEDPGHNQYGEYTYGKMYRFHSDHFLNRPEKLEDFEENGERIATLLYYLEVADWGGHTPFTGAGIYPYPIKGTAIFWYNMFRNGTLRPNVVHGSCPVVHGHKIMVNHFIRYNTNWNNPNGRCTLNSME